MIDKNILPKDATLAYSIGKNESIYTIGCMLHPADADALLNCIEDFIKNKTDKTREFSIMFNKEMEDVEKHRTTPDTQNAKKQRIG